MVGRSQACRARGGSKRELAPNCDLSDDRVGGQRGTEPDREREIERQRQRPGQRLLSSSCKTFILNRFLDVKTDFYVRSAEIKHRLKSERRVFSHGSGRRGLRSLPVLTGVWSPLGRSPHRPLSPLTRGHRTCTSAFMHLACVLCLRHQLSFCSWQPHPESADPPGSSAVTPAAATFSGAQPGRGVHLECTCISSLRSVPRQVRDFRVWGWGPLPPHLCNRVSLPDPAGIAHFTWSD